ncbi:MAG: GIN domain-containing protein [Sphingomonas sp.]
MRSKLPLFAAALALAAPALAVETVGVPQFRSVELRGGGSVVVVAGPAQRVTILEGSSQFTRIQVERDGRLRIYTCNEQCPRTYHLRVEIQSPAVPDLAISGGGVITAQGGFRPQSHLATAVNGGGRIDARAVEAASVSAAVNGGGEALVRPRSSLSAAVNGGGAVRYWGNPTVSMAVHGGGAVLRGG